ncbi:hypothetical protein DPMN_007006 [Dreissena polymorpha]|uniref:Uncharacterized protein n=1 Tax=Dreissena polymorpha TaxID=45954 RepID=A0A9D4MVD2_DREPO|nr:hypothetical protein DPMN_007006 [Dreissena polymorpha]
MRKYEGREWTTSLMIQAFENNYLGRLLLVSYLEHKINEYVRNMTAALVAHWNPS